MKSLSVLAVFVFVSLSIAQLTQRDVVGNWEEESKCVNLKVAPACKDEHVIYHIMPIDKRPNQVKVNADKVIDKTPIPMGEIIFTIDSKGSSMNNEMIYNGNKLIWNFLINGDKMTGTLMNRDKVIVRKITLKAWKKA